MVYWHYLLFGLICSLIWPLSTQMAITKPRRIILDVDVGSDDAFAMLALLDADKLGLVKVEAIVCSMGNTNLDNVSVNVIRVLELLKRTDVPVYKGAVGPLVEPQGELDEFFGKDGLGDLEYESYPDLSIIRNESAIQAIHDIVTKNPKEITLICVGPVTNAALAMRIFADVADNIRDMFIMGGNFLGIGNVSPAAEFNFFVDPESALAILEETKFPITVVPWEACLYTSITLDWRFRELGKYSSPFMDLLNRADKKIFSKKPLDDSWHACDVYTAVLALYPDVVLNQQKYNVTIETWGKNTRGQVVVRRKEDHKKSNINIIRQLNYSQIKNILIDIAERLV